jgi:leucyl-tRNA synthetase
MLFMNNYYDFAVIEKEAQDHWNQQQTFEVKEDLTKEKFYCLSMLPYPSGELHMGHVRNYTIGDVISRYQHLLGKNVLQPMGWDAFGLPAENAAIKNKLAPAEWTYKNIAEMRAQLKRLGFAIDWKRELATCKPEYYRWEQWLFLKLYKKGLAYKKNAVVNWDPVDQTVLANEQVVDGRGWRSGALVERREIPQWFLKITHYAEELLSDLESLSHWPEQVRTMQRNWIGRSEGIEIHFPVAQSDETIAVFTTRPDTLMGVSYLAIAPEHPLIKPLLKDNPTLADFVAHCRNIKVAEAELATLEKQGVPTGLTAIHPLTGESLPIWTANFVLTEYGTGAVMAVPAHDQRDFEFAQKYQLAIKPVISNSKEVNWNNPQHALTEKGILINSGPFDGLSSEQAFTEVAKVLIEKEKGEIETHYRLRDWGVSRQRYWGAPIPIIYCELCGTVPVPEKDLPVVLPENLIPDGTTSPLATCREFYETPCPQCGQPAKRETDTFDTFMESSWYYARYASRNQDTAMLDDRAKYWTPVNQYIGGIEHAVMHLLYARFIHKIMRDEGLLNSDEPFTSLLTQGMVLKDGAKMSKSKGNTVSPHELIEKYGADTVRFFIIFAAPPEQSLEWSDSGVEGSFRFLKRLWSLAVTAQANIKQLNQESQYKPDWKNASSEQQAVRKQFHQVLQQAQFDMDRLQFNTVASAAMKIFNALQDITPTIDPEGQLLHEGFNILLRVLAPITPHIAHQLWIELDYEGDILEAGWPKVDLKALKTSTYELVIQINGKMRTKVQVPADASEVMIKETVLNDDHVQQYLEAKEPKKIIIIPKRLVNIVV